MELNNKPRRTDAPLFWADQGALSDGYDMAHDLIADVLASPWKLSGVRNIPGYLRVALEMRRDTLWTRKIKPRSYFVDADDTATIIGGESFDTTQPHVDELLVGLSPRERTVAQLKANGHTVADIAARLDLNERTIKRDLAAMREKLAASVACPTSV